MENQEELRYPIGHFQCPKPITKEIVEAWILRLEELPEELSTLVLKLNDSQLETPYRPGGWTVRQLVHHIADSHHHSYTRFKWALTESRPLIKAYDEKEWSKLFDSQNAPIKLSLSYLSVLHAKLVFMLKALTEEDLDKYYIHPDGNIKVTVAENIGKYAWHGDHHLAHIKNLVQREGW